MDKAQYPGLLVLGGVCLRQGAQVIHGHFASEEQEASLGRPEGLAEIVGQHAQRGTIGKGLTVSPHLVEVALKEKDELLADDATNRSIPPSLCELSKRHYLPLLGEMLQPGREELVKGKVICAIGPILLLANPHPNQNIQSSNIRAYPSHGQVLGAQRRDQVHSHSHCPAERFELILPPKPRADWLSLIEGVIDLDQVHRDHPSFLGQPAHDVDRFAFGQPVAEARASLGSKLGVYCVDIEAQMKGGLIFRVQVLYTLSHDLSYAELVHVVHRIASHSVLGQCDVLIIIDVPDGNQDHILRREMGVLTQPRPLGEVGEGSHARHMRQRHPVIIVTQGGVGPEPIVDTIGMRVHPDDLQPRVEFMRG